MKLNSISNTNFKGCLVKTINSSKLFDIEDFQSAHKGRDDSTYIGNNFSGYRINSKISIDSANEIIKAVKNLQGDDNLLDLTTNEPILISNGEAHAVSATNGYIIDKGRVLNYEI